MGNRPQRGYDYNRPGVAMVTLKTRKSVRLCRITQEAFTLTEIGRVVQSGLIGIHDVHPQVKLGQYQIMPDHLHAMVHVVEPLPQGVTLQRVIRGFKIGLDRVCRKRFERESFQVFEKGMNHTLVFGREHLDCEVAYIRDNVRRYRLRRAHSDLFSKPKRVMTLPDGTELWGIGNLFLLEHPRRVRVQFSRSAIEEDWCLVNEALAGYLEQGYVFVSPFISPFEKRVLNEVMAQGGRAIRLTHKFFGERYKPMGKLFDLCCEGRLLELSVAGEFEKFARLDRAACLRLNEVAEVIATTQWSQWRG
jgi:hypothetical protein